MFSMTHTDWYFLRHGETEYNQLGLFQGQIDIPLNEAGRQQALEAKEELREIGLVFDEVVSSPLIRAVETAEILSGIPRNRFRMDERILEIGFGDYEGTSFRDPNSPIHQFNDDPASYHPRGNGETFEAVLSRTESFLMEMKERSLTVDDGKKILIASHGGVIRSFYRTLVGLKLSDFWNLRVGNCDLFHFSVTDGLIRECDPVLRHADPYDPHALAEQKSLTDENSHYT